MVGWIFYFLWKTQPRLHHPRNEMVIELDISQTAPLPRPRTFQQSKLPLVVGGY